MRCCYCGKADACGDAWDRKSCRNCLLKRQLDADEFLAEVRAFEIPLAWLGDYERWVKGRKTRREEPR